MSGLTPIVLELIMKRERPKIGEKSQH
jgi:hypothetical protein